MNLFYSLDETIKSYLDGEKNGLKYIKKKTFDKAVDDGKLTYNISGKTVLKKADPDNKEQRILRVSENETYALSNCKLTQLVGYIPVGDGVFVEYRKFNPLIFIPVILSALLIVIIAMLLRPNSPEPQGAIGYEAGQTNKSDEVPETNGESIEFPSVTMPGYSKLKIKANTKQVNTISLFNPEENEGWYDLAFTILADIDGDGEDETLYESEKIVPGYRISEFEMTQPIGTGSYNAKIIINPYYINDDEIVLNNGEISVPLIVE